MAARASSGPRCPFHIPQEGSWDQRSSEACLCYAIATCLYWIVYAKYDRPDRDPQRISLNPKTLLEKLFALVPKSDQQNVNIILTLLLDKPIAMDAGGDLAGEYEYVIATTSKPIQTFKDAKKICKEENSHMVVVYDAYPPASASARHEHVRALHAVAYQGVKALPLDHHYAAFAKASRGWAAGKLEVDEDTGIATWIENQDSRAQFDHDEATRGCRRHQGTVHPDAEAIRRNVKEHFAKATGAWWRGASATNEEEKEKAGTDFCQAHKELGDAMLQGQDPDMQEGWKRASAQFYAAASNPMAEFNTAEFIAGSVQCVMAGFKRA